MGKVFKFVLALLCAIICCHPSSAAALGTEDITDPGFVGWPMLAKYGYKAYAGEFRIEIGQGISNPGNLTDGDPNNYSTAAGIGATVALDHLCVVSPDPDRDESIITPKFKSGDCVGFVLSDGSNSGSVLNLDLIKMFVIYLYDGTNLVSTINAKGTDLDILGLSLVSYGAGMQTIKLTVPYDKDGNPIEFDGIGLGTAGIDVNAIEQVRIHYAFVDTLHEVPIIKRYFRNSSAATQGMVTGARNLVNNNTNDGATTAVLNIGGAYYDVYAGEPIPTGVEAGFYLTSGSVLDLNLGKAVRLFAIVKDADGNYKNINLTTGFDVVGLNAAGGGRTDVSAMIPPVLVDDEGNTYTEFYGLRLERISGVDVDLGATVVHYAYVKVPKMPADNSPFLASMYILPGASYVNAGLRTGAYYSAKQTYNNKILIRNSEVKPLLTQDLMPQAYRKGVWLSGPSGTNDYAMLSIFRSEVKGDGSETSPEYVGAISIWGESSGQWYYSFQKNLEGVAGLIHVPIPGPDENGVIDFGDIELSLATIDETYQMKDNPSGKIVGFNYWLYVHENNDNGYKEMDTGYELDYSDIVVPQIAPTFEIAGVHTEDEIKDLDINDTPHADIKTGAYKNYVEVVIPDRIDYKTEVDKITLYRHARRAGWAIEDENQSVQYGDVVLSTGRFSWGKDVSGADADPAVQYVHSKGASKIIVGVEPISDKKDEENYYVAAVSVKLTDAYTKELDNAFPRHDFPVDAVYGWVPAKATEHAVPTLHHLTNSTQALEIIWTDTERVKLLKTFLQTDLNDAVYGHTGAGDILYSQWGSIVAQDAPQRVRAAAAADSEQTQHTTFNEYQNPPELKYSESGDSHSATLHMRHDLPEGSGLKYDVTTRAYVPVLPSGFTSAQIAPSYLVAQTSDKDEIDAPILTGVEQVGIGVEIDAPAEFFTLSGARIAEPVPGTICIMRRGASATKVIVK